VPALPGPALAADFGRSGDTSRLLVLLHASYLQLEVWLCGGIAFPSSAGWCMHACEHAGMQLVGSSVQLVLIGFEYSIFGCRAIG
jgi:hypothetical protein